MSQTVKEVLDFVKDNDVKFVKLTFCDSFGNIKNISIIADELPTAFEKAGLRSLFGGRICRPRRERFIALSRRLNYSTVALETPTRKRSEVFL